MTRSPFRFAMSVPATALLALALSGCSGGGGGMSDQGGGDEPPTFGAAAVPFMVGVERHFSDNEAAARTVLLRDDGATTIARTADGWDVTVAGTSVTFTDNDLGADPFFPGA